VDLSHWRKLRMSQLTLDRGYLSLPLPLIFLFLILLAGCGQVHKPAESSDSLTGTPGYYGQVFDTTIAVSSQVITSMFNEENTMQLTLTGPVEASCTHSGCWMDIGIGDGKVMNVTFSDGDFKIPLDAAGSYATMHGTAYRELVPAERLRAYARDEGMSEEEIAAITEDDWEYSFVASGVTLK